ncbi:hypothetical protein BD414DRAFT_504767 [Trametes punicea]|nr:hypothetical protein BD414DRAFT_504767 [Trametes punicea]
MTADWREAGSTLVARVVRAAVQSRSDHGAIAGTGGVARTEDPAALTAVQSPAQSPGQRMANHLELGMGSGHRCTHAQYKQVRSTDPYARTTNYGITHALARTRQDDIGPTDPLGRRLLLILYAAPSSLQKRALALRALWPPNGFLTVGYRPDSSKLVGGVVLGASSTADVLYDHNRGGRELASSYATVDRTL